MDTNGHEWQKKYQTTKGTKGTKGTKISEKFRTTNGHEWTRMAKELFNHEIHEKHEKKAGGRVGTTNGHEWTRIAKELFNHETHERHEKKAGGESRNHEWTRMDTSSKRII